MNLIERILNRLNEQEPHPGHGPATGQSQSWTPGVETAPKGYAKKEKAIQAKNKAKAKTYPNEPKIPAGDTKSDSYRIHQVMARMQKEKAAAKKPKVIVPKRAGTSGSRGSGSRITPGLGQTRTERILRGDKK